MRSDKALLQNDLHIDFVRLAEFASPVQVFAICLDESHLGNAFEYANAAIDFFDCALEKHGDMIKPALTMDDLERNAKNGKASAMLALEGGEPLEGEIGYVDHFYDRGVRIITLTWNRENELGYGAFANEGGGLKQFGAECVRRMNDLGIVVDVSHLSEAGFLDVDRISRRPYIASHSNAFSITPHIRNLKDAQIKSIAGKGGVIGINLCPDFLSPRGGAYIDSIMAHIGHFIDIGAADSLGLGCDLDGIAETPDGITDVTSLKTLASAISDRFGSGVSKKIMSGNFHDFFRRFFA
jgi:membrane dipeptidase